MLTSHSEILYNCVHSLTQKQLHHVASVPGVKMFISSSVLFFLSSCLFLSHISRLLLQTQILLRSKFMTVLSKGQGKCGGNKAFECKSHIWLFGCWTMSWLWKFMQLRADSTPPPPVRKICSTAHWERLMCFPPADQTLQSQTWGFMQPL